MKIQLPARPLPPQRLVRRRALVLCSPGVVRLWVAVGAADPTCVTQRTAAQHSTAQHEERALAQVGCHGSERPVLWLRTGASRVRVQYD